MKGPDKDGSVLLVKESLLDKMSFYSGLLVLYSAAPYDIPSRRMSPFISES